MEKNIKVLGKEKMFCSICEEEHDVEFIKEEREIYIKGEKVKHKEKMYRCNKYTEENTFETEKLWNENLINSFDAYREKKDLLTSKEIKLIRNSPLKASFNFVGLFLYLAISLIPTVPIPSIENIIK